MLFRFERFHVSTINFSQLHIYKLYIEHILTMFMSTFNIILHLYELLVSVKSVYMSCTFLVVVSIETNTTTTEIYQIIELLLLLLMLLSFTICLLFLILYLCVMKLEHTKLEDYFTTLKNAYLIDHLSIK